MEREASKDASCKMRGKGNGGTNMKPVVVTALALLLLLFLWPMVFLGGPAPAPEESESLPTATLPIDRASVRPAEEWAGKSDGETVVRVKQADGTVTALSMADYLWRVVAAEMPASFEPEALKAQAATARTYTLYKMLNGPVTGHTDADVCTDITCCQAYIDPAQAAANWGDAAPLYTQKIADAVAATDGQAILYGGRPIDAVFFSSAAGSTLDAVEVWGGSVPYLTGVASPEGEEVPGYRSQVTVPLEAFKTAFLAQYPPADLSGEAAGWFQNTVPTSNGGVETVDVGGVTVKGTALRTLFDLRSTHFTASAGPEGITFHVTGYGHGVGLSQYGANALAKQGRTWQEIVAWYYTGVTVGTYAT